MKIKIKPSDFECPLINCPPGLFLYGEMIGLKTEYSSADTGGKRVEAYCDTGETFCAKDDVLVIPLEYEVDTYFDLDKG